MKNGYSLFTGFGWAWTFGHQISLIFPATTLRRASMQQERETSASVPLCLPSTMINPNRVKCVPVSIPLQCPQPVMDYGAHILDAPAKWVQGSTWVLDNPAGSPKSQWRRGGRKTRGKGTWRDMFKDEQPGVAGRRGGWQEMSDRGRLRPDRAGLTRKSNESVSLKWGLWFPDTGPALFVLNVHF